MKYFCLLTLILSCLSQANELNIHIVPSHEQFLESNKSYKAGWEIISRAAKFANVTLRTTYSPWSKSTTLLKQGKADASFLAFYSTQRALDFGFSAPIGIDSISLVSIKQKELNTIKYINYSNFSVGVSKQSLHFNVAKKLGFKNIYESLARPELHRMLDAGRIDFIIETDSIIEDICSKQAKLNVLPCFKVITQPLQNKPLFLIYNKKDSKVLRSVEKINKAIGEMNETGEIEKIFLVNGYSINNYNTWQLAWDKFNKKFKYFSKNEMLSTGKSN